MTEDKKVKPKIAQTEMDKLDAQFQAFDKNVQELTQDRMKAAPKEEVEPQTKIAQSDLDKKKDIYLKPHKTISCKEKFNEKFREDYNFKKEYVHFIAENHEIIGESLDLWTRPFPGMPAEEWKVPTNTPVWGPRYLAEQIKSCSYHRLKMQQTTTGGDGMGQYYGSMAVDTTVQRLDAIPVSSKKSIFMGANSF
jgi:hypothetical protein